MSAPADAGADGPRRRGFELDLGLLAVFALALATWGGVPFAHRDAITRHALHVLRDGGNPGFFDYPALVFDLDALVYGALYLLARAGGCCASFASFEREALAGRLVHPGGFSLAADQPAAWVTAAFACAGVMLAYAMARTLTGRRDAGWIAGLLLGGSLLWVANAHDPTVDVPLATLAMATSLATLLAVRRDGLGAPRTLATLGVLAGLTASAKYNGVLALVAPLAAVAGASWRRPATAARRMALLGAWAAAAFLATNPIVFQRFHRYLVTLRTMTGKVLVSHVGYQHDGPTWGWHVTHTLRTGFGDAGLLLALAGIGLLAFAPRRAAAERLAVLAFPVAYFAHAGSIPLTFARYMVPLLPFLAVFAALAVVSLHARLGGRGGLPAMAAAAIVACALLPNLRASVAFDRMLARPDTRVALAHTLAAMHDADPRLTVAMSPVLRGVLANLEPRALADALDIEQPGPERADVLVVDSFEYDRNLDDPRAGPAPFAAALAGRVAFVVSPFTASRERVPGSPESVYAPYPPDLAFRSSPGPYVELYASARAADRLRAAGARGIAAPFFAERLRAAAAGRAAP